MSWLYNLNYFGPDRRSKRFQVRFLERRRAEEAGSRATLREGLRGLASRGLRWVDHLNYFGPDRRSDVFSYFFLERRRKSSAGTPPPLHAALRQLRVRVLQADEARNRVGYSERLTATALLADAHGQSAIGDLLTALASRIDAASADETLSGLLQSELLRAEAMLGDVPAAG